MVKFDFERWTDGTGSLGPHSLRQARWCDVFTKRSAAVSAELLDRVARVARTEPAAMSSYLGLIPLGDIVARVGGEKMARILSAAHELDFQASSLVLEFHGKRHVPDELGPPPDPIIERISLGHRKTAARGGRGQLLDRLLKDPDPVVVVEALRNPRLRESEVLAIASRRPAPEIVFANLAASSSWIARPAIRNAIVMNPYSPPSLSVMLLVTLNGGSLAEIAKDEAVHPSVRDGAAKALSWGPDF